MELEIGDIYFQIEEKDIEAEIAKFEEREKEGKKIINRVKSILLLALKRGEITKSHCDMAERYFHRTFECLFRGDILDAYTQINFIATGSLPSDVRDLLDILQKEVVKAIETVIKDSYELEPKTLVDLD